MRAISKPPSVSHDEVSTPWRQEAKALEDKPPQALHIALGLNRYDRGNLLANSDGKAQPEAA
jgi:hypothetical protein